MSFEFAKGRNGNGSGRQRILLAQRACAEFYPPVLHQAFLLSEAADVTLLDALTEKDDSKVQTDDRVTRMRLAQKSSSSKASKLLQRARALKSYAKEFRKQLAANMDVAIAYDPDAAVLLMSSNGVSKNVKRVIHLHEITKDSSNAPLGYRLKLQYMLRSLSRADLVILPDKHRADLLQSRVRLRREPLVVMNCPRRLPTVPNSLLLPLLRERGITTSRIVHYQGALGPHHGLETVIKSMRLWPSDSVFVVVGAGSAEYLKKLGALTTSEGVQDRIIFTGRVPYDQVFQYAAGASVGLTLLDTSFPNWELSAGASNKRFEYAALGIPQVTNDGPGIQELFGKPGIATIADHRDVPDVGKKIARYLENMRWGKEVGQNARALHLQSYNYEQQFKKVLEIIRPAT
ncbi:MAG: glycosyltransferase family 4 protein [Pyrinomonadaceae bacterium]